jgi:hypothetical protein
MDALSSFLSGKQAGIGLQQKKLALDEAKQSAPHRAAMRDVTLERQQQQLQSRQGAQSLQGMQLLGQFSKRAKQLPLEQRVSLFENVKPALEKFGVDISGIDYSTDFTDAGLAELDTGLGQVQQQMTSGQREFEHLADAGGFTPEQKQQAARVAAGIEAKPLSLTPEQVAERERQKLEAQKGLKAEVAGEIETAKGLAKEEIKKQVKQEKEKITYKVFTKALDGLSQALGATSLTGPLLGRLPAATTSAQIAEGAKAIMLPTLKNIFREAGEGTFTDSDQKALEQLLPRRGQTKEAQIAQIEAIEKIVKAKLNIPEAKEGGQLMIDANGNKAMVYPDGSYEEV